MDDFERMVRGAMEARPEAVAGMDVAAAALSRARGFEEGLARVARVRWWGRVLGVAAGLLIVGTVGVGVWAMPVSTSGETTETVSSGESSTADMGSVGMGALAVAVVGVAGVSVMGGAGGKV